MKPSILTGLSLVGALLLTACGTSTNTSSGSPTSPMAGMTSMTPSPSSTGMAGMSMHSGNGLTGTLHGYSLKASSTAAAGVVRVRFTITHAGRRVTAFAPEQTKLMHFYLIRSDLTGFQHLHPVMDSQGVWSVTTSPLARGSHRIYVQFVPRAATSSEPLVLSRSLTIGKGSGSAAPLPPPSWVTTVDGYTVSLSGTLKAGVDSKLTLRFTKDGQAVTDLQPYLDTYAHITAIRAGDLAFAHLHPDAGSVTGLGGPVLKANADLPEPGRFRMFIQFQTSGVLHTAALTVAVA